MSNTTATGKGSEVARLVELRDEMERALEEECEEPWPHWWPALDMAVRQLNRGSDYSVCNLARVINNLPFGWRWSEIHEGITEAAYELANRSCGSEGGEDSE